MAGAKQNVEFKVTVDQLQAIQGWLADEHADVQVELHPGGQPLYPYLFGVE